MSAVISHLLALVERPFLTQRILQHLDHGSVVIAAAPGYGKTALLYLLARQIPRSRVLPLSLADRDVLLLQARLEEAGQDADVFLLDDLHVLEGADEALDWLGRQVAAHPGKWILSGRWMPDTITHHILGASNVLWLTEADLALSPEETVLWLAQAGYSSAEGERWHAYTRGWPLAVSVLARLSTRFASTELAATTLENFLETQLFARLWQELSADLQCFLALTGTALQFCPELAVHLWRSYKPTAPPSQAEALWQAVVHRRLFVEPGTRAGYWRYHELFRAFLRKQAPDRPEIVRTIVAWFRGRQDYAMAIEQALADELWEEATELLLELPMEVIWNANRVYTYRRWILSLPQDKLRTHPILLTRLGAELCASGDLEEGLRLVEEGARWLEAQETPEAMCQAYRALAQAYLVTGRYAQALEYGHRLRELATEDKYRRNAAVILSNTYAVLGYLPRARRFYREAIAIAEAMGDVTMAVYQRDNLAGYVLAPMGHLGEAESLLRQNQAYYQAGDRPSAHIVHLEQWAALYAEVGDWKKMQAVLQEVEKLVEEVEVLDRTSNYWRFWFWALYHIGVQEWEQAEECLARAATSTADRPDRLLYLAQLRAWLARRRGRPEEAIHLAEEALARPWDAPLARALVALERDIAAAEASVPLPLHPETRFLLSAHALPSLVRLRALLVWRCFQQGRPEARRHVRALAATLRRFPHLFTVLTRRDPDLGFRAWRAALLLGEAEEMAVEALGCIGRVAELADMLSTPDPEIRRRAAAALAATRREEAMPLLYAALKRERHGSVRVHLERALGRLESQPPPPLRVQFFGRFRVWRGDKEIPEHTWPRPAVVRLFQYFVVHRGQPLTRDKVLDDLWPDLPPEKAYQTLRRLLSWLRRVLEPYMHPKGPFRYLSTAWDVYTFDPDDRVWVDAEHFESVIRNTLQQARQADVPPLPDELLTLLREWKPPVSKAPYEDWWLRWAKRWQQMYVDGCLYVAHAYLARREEHQAIEWADRAIAIAPWTEEAYQVKMRALARLGRRTDALRTYEEAQAALWQELGVPPSDLTEWLAERLRRGEMI